VGATLIQALFDRAAYGCRLFCCWCAQDIDANYFWESLGFVPLAFRAGSEKRARVHIFWQKRIRAGDTSTPWWFPSQTGSGSLREDRLVLPIPPGTHWKDAKPMVLPTQGVEGARGQGAEGEEKKVLPGAAAPAAPRSRAKKPRPQEPPAKPEPTRLSGFRFAAPQAAPSAEPAAKAKPKREAKVPGVKRKNDPKLVAAARELRDRWLERVNLAGGERLLPTSGKYDVTRPPELIAEQAVVVEPVKILPAA
jgi:hypothetical protein